MPLQHSIRKITCDLKIQFFFLQEKGNYLILEIQLCISKTLELLSCDKFVKPHKECLKNDLYYPAHLNYTSKN